MIAIRAIGVWSIAVALTFAAVAAIAPYASAKGRDSIVARMVQTDFDAIVLARAEGHDEAGAIIVIEKSYAGNLTAGDRIANMSDTRIQHCANLDRENNERTAANRFVLFLYRKSGSTGTESKSTAKWQIDRMISKCVVDVGIYAWAFHVTDHYLTDMAAVERRIEAGLSGRQRWLAAWEAEENALRLELLRPLFSPSDDSFIAHYDVAMLTSVALNKLDPQDAKTRQFVEDLLTLPHYQENYAVTAADGNWGNFGRGQRQRLQRFLDPESSAK